MTNELAERVLDAGVDQFVDACLRLNYRCYLSGKWNVNIFGIRSADTTPNKWNDCIGIVYTDGGEKERIFAVEGTTDPGKTPLMTPVNSKGCAILVPGQYTGAYEIGIHNAAKKTAHQALVQRHQPVNVYRDGNRDFNYDMIDSTIERGFFGINIHRASKWGPIDEPDLYSAGCQVINDPQDFADFMSFVKKSSAVYGNRFTYTLFTEQEYFI